MADIYRVPYSASFVSLPSKSRSFVSPKPTPSVVWQQSLSLLRSRPLPASRDVSPGLPAPGWAAKLRIRFGRAGRRLREIHGAPGAAAAAWWGRRKSRYRTARGWEEWGPQAAPPPQIPVRCSSGWTRSSQTERRGFLAEPEGGVPNVSRGRVGLSSNPVGLTRVPALPFLFRFSELDS